MVKILLQNHKIHIFIVFFLVSLFLYFYKFERLLTFDFDQEFYAYQYVRIFKEGKPTLLGIETSVGGMFVGPLYTYFSSLVYWVFKGDPAGMGIMTLLLASFQASLTYLVFSSLKNEKVGIVGGFLVLFSSSLWNKAYVPSVINFLYPAGLLFYYFLANLDKNKRYIIYLGILLGLTFHLHPSLLFFFPIFVFYVIKKNLIKYFYTYESILGIVIIFIFLLPLLIFEWRHDYFILKNVLKFIGGQMSISNTQIMGSYFTRIYNLGNSYWSLLAHFLANKPGILTFGVVLIILGYSIFRIQKDTNLKITAYIFLVTSILLSFYRGTIPDYYLYFLLAPFLYIASVFLEKISSDKKLVLIFGVYLIFLAFGNIRFMMMTYNPYNLALKKQAAQYIKNESGEGEVRILYDTSLGLGFGFNYLLDYYGVKQSSNNYSKIYQIIIREPSEKSGVEFRYNGAPAGIKVARVLEKSKP